MLSPGIEKCGDQVRDQKVRLVLKELGYENKVCNVMFKWK